MEDGNYVYCVNTVGGFQCRQKVVNDDNCEEDEEGKIIVDVANNWKYRGTADRTTGIITGTVDGFCKPGTPCTIGDVTYAPYCTVCYVPGDLTTCHGWDYCKCKSKFKNYFVRLSDHLWIMYLIWLYTASISNVEEF